MNIAYEKTEQNNLLDSNWFPCLRNDRWWRSTISSDRRIYRNNPEFRIPEVHITSFGNLEDIRGHRDLDTQIFAS